MGRSNYDMSDWLIRLKKDNTLQLKKKTQIKYNHIYISLNSTLQCNLIEGFMGVITKHLSIGEGIRNTNFES